MDFPSKISLDELMAILQDKAAKVFLESMQDEHKLHVISLEDVYKSAFQSSWRATAELIARFVDRKYAEDAKGGDPFYINLHAAGEHFAKEIRSLYDNTIESSPEEAPVKTEPEASGDSSGV